MSALPLTAPKGLRDLLPDATERLSAIQARVAHGFAQAGYQRVTTPAFEYADVLERGLEIDRRDLVRFVEPDSGEVALLRPDMTPQVARIAATRLAHLPPPLRLSYRGTVIRRREGRARRSRMSSHAGVECIGRAAPQGDEEVLRLACETLVALGLPRWHLELGQVSVAGAVLERVPEALRARAKAALSRKDAVAIDALGSAIAPDLRILAELYGDASVIDDARRLLASSKYPELNAALDELETMVPIAEGAIADVPDATLGIDLGELRGHGYYTGFSFKLLAPGPGIRLGGGGRYDRLLARFGLDLPATGFGLDLDHLQWALAAAGASPRTTRPCRLLWCADGPLRDARDAGFQVAPFDGDANEARAHAKAWGYDGIVASTLERASDGSDRALPASWDDEALHGWLASGRAEETP